MKPYKCRAKARRDMEQIDKGLRQHDEHDEETDIQCHCSAKETKYIKLKTVCHISFAGREKKYQVKNIWSYST